MESEADHITQDDSRLGNVLCAMGIYETMEKYIADIVKPIATIPEDSLHSRYEGINRFNKEIVLAEVVFEG